MNKQFKIVEKSKIFFCISAALIVLGIILMIVPGLNLGLDFTEGATITVNLNISPSDSDTTYVASYKDFIEDQGFEVENTRITSANGSSVYQFDLNYRYNGEVLGNGEFSDALGDEERGLISQLIDHINANEGNVIPADKLVEGEDIVSDDWGTYSFTSPDATRSLTVKAVIAIAVAIVCMLIYIGIRFKFTSGLAAVIVLIHDVLIMITLTAIFRVTVNLTFIAAIITVIGYSINATIIVFDRIKDNLAKAEALGMTDADVANLSIKETLRRTIFTTLTTLIMIVLIAILGVSSIREFAMPIIFGLLSGVYSAIVLSSCVWVQIRKLAKKISSNKKKGYKKIAKGSKAEA